MKIELRNIKIYERLSEETTCFTADIFIDGKKAGTAENRGNGGCTDYDHYENTKQLMRDAESYLQTLPPLVYELPNIKKFELPCNLENLIDKMVDEEINRKYEKKKQADMLKGIVYGDENCYSVTKWHNKYTIATILQLPAGVKALQTVVDRIKAQGHKILNTNLPPEIIL